MVGEVRRRLGEVRVADRPGAEELAVGLEEADAEEERPVVVALEDLDRQRRNRFDLRRRDLHHLVVADDVGLLGDVLLADQRRAVADLVQGVDDVVRVVVQRPAAVRQPEHAVGVAVLAGQQAGP
jgi:hypothetical protein